MKIPGSVIVAAALLLGSCVDKPSEDECRRAVTNIQQITGTTRAEGGADPKMAIRSCRARSQKKTVDCQIAAKTLEDLAQCEGEEGKAHLERIRKAEEAAAAAARDAGATK
jgi:hypothetical protein